jgi:hypothetical protein
MNSGTSLPDNSESAPADGCSCNHLLHRRIASAPTARRARTAIAFPRSSITAFGVASRLSAQLGSFDIPRFIPARTRSSPSRKQATAVVRGRPVLRPVVVRDSTGCPAANTQERRRAPPPRRSNHAWSLVTRVLAAFSCIGERVARASQGPRRGRPTSLPSRTPKKRRRLDPPSNGPSEVSRSAVTGASCQAIKN